MRSYDYILVTAINKDFSNDIEITIGSIDLSTN